MRFNIHVQPCEHETPLCHLMGRYGSDKGNAANTARHDYTRYYHELFAPHRQTVTRLFELGIFQGASLRAWRDYFPNAQIYGADINPSCMFSEDRIRTILCDETRASEVNAALLIPDGPLDVILDDGLHTYEDCERFFLWAWERLRSGGVYIIEDLPMLDLTDFAEKCEGHLSVGRDGRLLVVDRVVNGEDVPDNNLLVMVKP